MNKLILLVVPFLWFATCKDQIKDPLVLCLKNAKDTAGLINDKVKDSAFLKLCERYHREMILEKYCCTLVPKQKWNEKKRILENELDEKGKIIYIKASKISIKGTLQFIEKGMTDNIQ